VTVITGFRATALKIRPSNCCLRGGLYHVIMAPRRRCALREQDHAAHPATPRLLVTFITKQR